MLTLCQVFHMDTEHRKVVMPVTKANPGCEDNNMDVVFSLSPSLRHLWACQRFFDLRNVGHEVCLEGVWDTRDLPVSRIFVQLVGSDSGIKYIPGPHRSMEREISTSQFSVA